jgi:hypothetical protein
MIRVSLTPRELGLGAIAGVYRQIGAMQNGRSEIKGAAADPWDAHIEGALAEMAVSKFLGIYWSGTSFRFQDGDVGPYQVRSSRRPDAHLLIHEREPDEAPFLLVTGAAPDFTIRGWILGREAKRPEWVREGPGHKAAYWVPQGALREIEALLERGLEAARL